MKAGYGVTPEPATAQASTAAPATAQASTAAPATNQAAPKASVTKPKAIRRLGGAAHEDTFVPTKPAQLKFYEESGFDKFEFNAKSFVSILGAVGLLLVNLILVN